MTNKLHARTLIDADKVREARVQRGLTQEETAHQVGMSFASISRIENKHVKHVSALTKMALERVLGVDLTPKVAAIGTRDGEVTA